MRDGQGQKMSKTTGNVIDPLDTIDKLGADALRYSLVTGERSYDAGFCLLYYTAQDDIPPSSWYIVF